MSRLEYSDNSQFTTMIGLRYLRSGRRSRFASFIAVISVLGIAMGVLSLIVVISVMNGFQGELRNRLLGMATHISVSDSVNKDHDWSAIRQSLLKETQVSGVAPYIDSDVILMHAEAVSPAILRGIDPILESQVSAIPDSMLQGSVEQLVKGQFFVILGIELAQSLDVGPGDQLRVMVPVSSKDGVSVIPKVTTLLVKGVFQANVPQYDGVLAVIHIDTARAFLSGTSAQTGLRVMLEDMDEAPSMRRKLESSLPLNVMDWGQMHQSFFTAVMIEKVVMFLILMMIIAVAAFNIVSTLAVNVSEKQSDIAILKSLGANSRQIMKIFWIQGTVIGVIGTLTGTVSGVIIAWFFPEIICFFENLFGFKIFSPEIFYISEIPSILQWMDVVLVSFFGLLISSLATLYPSLRAAGIEPAKALRYE